MQILVTYMQELAALFIVINNLKFLIL